MLHVESRGVGEGSKDKIRGYEEWTQTLTLTLTQNGEERLLFKGQTRGHYILLVKAMYIGMLYRCKAQQCCANAVSIAMLCSIAKL